VSNSIKIIHHISKKKLKVPVGLPLQRYLLQTCQALDQNDGCNRILSYLTALTFSDSKSRRPAHLSKKTDHQLHPMPKTRHLAGEKDVII